LHVPEPAIGSKTWLDHDRETAIKEGDRRGVALLGSVSVRLAVPPKSQVAPPLAWLFRWK
jgi:hypothetical protein